MPNFPNRTLYLGAIAAVQAGLFATLTPIRPAMAGFNQFDICVSELQNRGISDRQATAACSDALKPRDLSKCVQRISVETPITANEALSACYRVRRPVELADCTIGITNEAQDAYVRTNVSASAIPENQRAQVLQPTALLALEGCRLSLLPQLYSECVIASSRRTSLSPSDAMKTCIKAEDSPRF